MNYKENNMDILNRIDRLMLSESKTKVSPLLKSIYTKQDNIDKAQAEGLASALDKVTDKDTLYTVSHGLPIGSSTAQVIIKRSDEDYTTSIDKVKNVLSNKGFSVISSAKSDGKTWTIKFKVK